MAAVDYDPYSEEAMLDPHRLYAALRAHDPVHRLEAYDAWALAGFAEVWQACSDTASFSVRRGQTPNQVLLGVPAASLEHLERVLGQFEAFCTVTQSVGQGIPITVEVLDSTGARLK